LQEGVLNARVASSLAAHVSESDTSNGFEGALLGCYPHLNGILGEFDGPFDARMSVFVKGVEAIQRSMKGQETDSLAVGYLCNRILPGSFAHSRVLVRLVEFFPSALVWYGMFCATSPGFDAYQFGNGIFAKLSRDISRPFSFAQRPQCDLSLDEMEVLMRTSAKSEAIKPIQTKIAAVALLPGLDVLSRFTPEEDDAGHKEPPAMRSGAADGKFMLVVRLLDEATSLLRELAAQGKGSPTQSKPKRQKKK
jgi:hypothetical protein